jgi:transketolase
MKTAAGATAEMISAANRIRIRLVGLSHRLRIPHLGSSLSCVDILVAAYWGCLRVDPACPTDPNRDRLILSKGHAATALYAALDLRGFWHKDILCSLAEAGGMLPEHPVAGSAPGIEVTSGSLGHGLSLGLGMALAARIQKRSYRVYVVMSDGECNEGSVWEAALLAPAKKIDNLVAIIDYNRWQATDRSEEVMAIAPLRTKFEAFGWSAHDVDGHNISSLVEILDHVPDGSGKPVAVIARTIKGKGVSFMEDDNNWHYRVPSVEEYERAMTELNAS